MRITKFFVDTKSTNKMKPGIMKLGNQWNFDERNYLSERRVDDYSWIWDSEPKPNIAGPAGQIKVIWIKDKDEAGAAITKLRFGFEIAYSAGEYTVSTPNAPKDAFGVITDLTGIVVTQPNPFTPVPGYVEIPTTLLTNANQYRITFTLAYDPSPAAAGTFVATKDTVKKLYSIQVIPDQDWMRAPMIDGPFQRQYGKWVK